ncbi:hypothetical protein CC80DRAFT_415111 [Byssothecium circinans]|uniref:Uncharacterized protein n=1 Tax=Byssothecium circinans TaxID=147558 RepID=A0A6A5TY64_9PLEO|nr:hypothetical protein CC80DRAFT_415111 [Byssothecium circinans]
MSIFITSSVSKEAISYCKSTHPSLHYPSTLTCIKAPARASVTYSLREGYSANHDAESEYSGFPNEANNNAWEDLIYPMFFNATASEILKAGSSPEDSVLLAEGGYISALGVYHELHCLRRIRLFLYAPVYYPTMTPANLDYVQKHLDHCLETLRISLMCTADLSLYNFRWHAADDDRPQPETHGRRKCANWESVDTWARTRRLDYDPVLVRTTGKKERVQL